MRCNNNDNQQETSHTTHRCLRSSCSANGCKAGPGLQFGRLIPTPTKRKKQKVNKLLKDKNLFENNNNRDIFYTDDESQDLLIHKCSSLNFESVDKHSKAVTFVAKEFNDSVDTDSEKWYSKKVNDLLDLWSHKAKHIINSSAIHELYIQYLNQSQLQKDLTKTDYTYAKSISYNKNISNTSNLFDWLVPNMSRKSISSSVKTSTQLSRTLSTHTKTEIINNSINSSNLMLSNTERESSVSPDKRSPNDQMFTRSHCLGGNQCEAGCEVHKKARRRYNKSGEILIPNSGQGLEPMEPEIEFSDDDDYAMNNRRNQQLLNNYRQNGHTINERYNYYEDEDEEDEEEELTIVKRVTNIFKTTINNTSRIIDSVTPNAVKRATNKCPLIFRFVVLLLFLTPCIYLLSHYISSPLPYSSFDGLVSDYAAKDAINALIKEMKTMRNDLNQLRQTNSDMNSKMKNNEFNENEKFTHLSEKMDKIEEYLNNSLKNCCQNNTESLIALIDLRLSAFMSSLLSNNQNTRQSMSPSEAVEELKSFINFELMKTNDVFRESIEQKLMTTIEKFEEQMKRESKSITSNITIGKVRSLISEALAVYDADKTGQPDYALEPSGGTIINTRCSETYDPHGVQYKIFGIPFWSSSVSPRAVIQPTISPGECWAFRGSNGYLVIRLSQAIYPSGFTYEHISKQISRDGNIDSAPKEFQVRALDDETDTTGHLLGNYVYEDNNTPMQYFAVEDPNPRAVELIELVILSNHGHNDYTCLYRFRIHGKRINT